MTKFKIKDTNKENNIDEDKRKKIAIYYSGRIEHNKYKINKDRLEEYEKKYNVTHFCSLNKEANGDEFTNNFCKDFNITEDRINIEKTILPDEIQKSDIAIEGNLNNMYSMFYHNYKCIELIKKYQERHNYKFDIIMKYRSDVYSQHPIEFEKLEDNTIYIPHDADYGGINDQIAYGNYNSMFIYSKCNLEFLECAKKTRRFHPESILLQHLKNSKLNIVRFKFNYRLNK